MAAKLTKAQILEIKKAFDAFDINHDGTITAMEFGEVLKSKGIVVTPKEMRQMIGEVDLDGNGEIDEDEFISMMAKYIKTKTLNYEEEDYIRQQFEQFDKDHNGYIDANELILTMQHFGVTITQADARGMIAMADSDGNGQIDFDEFHKLLVQFMEEDRLGSG